jgi:hypothetical protein
LRFGSQHNNSFSELWYFPDAHVYMRAGGPRPTRKSCSSFSPPPQMYFKNFQRRPHSNLYFLRILLKQLLLWRHTSGRLSKVYFVRMKIITPALRSPLLTSTHAHALECCFIHFMEFWYVRRARGAFFRSKNNARESQVRSVLFGRRMKKV